MNRRIYILSTFILMGVTAMAQHPATSAQYMKAYSKDATKVIFASGTDISTCKIPASPVKWGMDTAWDSEDNVTRGTNYIGKDVLSIGRVSFQPSDLVDDSGNLSDAQQKALQSRLDHIYISGVRDVILNCDHESLVKDNYYGKPYEWYRVIKASVEYCKSKGFNVITISPFNEPDYTSWGEGTKDDFLNICKYINEDSDLAGIRISAGNTLNCDQALTWYNYMKPYVSEGNTHQLAGSFDSYVTFWQTVRGDGNYASADEMHNVGEAFIGVHYGLQAGVWWGFESAARGEYCRSAFYGKEIGYGENRDSWSAATVYKREDGRIDAFLGVSERQAKTSSYELINTDRPVYYDGHGPSYNYMMEMPGGTGYQTSDQCNAERMIQVQYGEDVPVEPIDSGAYVIMNLGNKKVIGFSGGDTADGTSLLCSSYTGSNSKNYQQWIVEPVSSRVGTDFSFYFIKSVRNKAQMIDLLNWSTSENSTICGYSGSGGSNEQWMLEYAGNGDWYIRSRHSGLYLDGKTGTIRQQAKDTTSVYQRWRFMQTNASRETVAPAAPKVLTAKENSASVRLSWAKNKETDLVGYQVERGFNKENGETQWDVIGRMLTDTIFVDNTLTPGQEYIYKVKAIDKARNRSVASEEITAKTSDNPALVARYCFNKSLNDTTENYLDPVLYGKEYYTTLGKKEGTYGLNLMTTSGNYLALPKAAVDHKQMTITAWVYNLSSTSSWTRVFDFGNGENQYMFLTPNNGSEMRLVLKDNGDEQILSASKLNAGMHHVAVTLGDDGVTLYVDGALVASSEDISIRPSDFHPVINYIGRSQFAADPLFRGYIDDFRIYNYALTADEVLKVYNGATFTGIKSVAESENPNGNSVAYTLDGRKAQNPSKGIFVKGNKKIIMK